MLSNDGPIQVICGCFTVNVSVIHGSLLHDRLSLVQNHRTKISCLETHSRPKTQVRVCMLKYHCIEKWYGPHVHTEWLPDTSNPPSPDAPILSVVRLCITRSRQVCSTAPMVKCLSWDDGYWQGAWRLEQQPRFSQITLEHGVLSYSVWLLWLWISTVQRGMKNS